MPTPKLDIKRVIDAGVGVTDLAVGTVRDYAAEAQKRVTAAQQSVKETVATFDPKATYAAIEKRAKDIQAASRSTIIRPVVLTTRICRRMFRSNCRRFTIFRCAACIAATCPI